MKSITPGYLPLLFTAIIFSLGEYILWRFHGSGIVDPTYNRTKPQSNKGSAKSFKCGSFWFILFINNNPLRSFVSFTNSLNCESATSLNSTSKLNSNNYSFSLFSDYRSKLFPTNSPEYIFHMSSRVSNIFSIYQFIL